MSGKVVEVNKGLAADPSPLNAPPLRPGGGSPRWSPKTWQKESGKLSYGEKVFEWLQEEINKHAK